MLDDPSAISSLAGACTGLLTHLGVIEELTDVYFNRITPELRDEALKVAAQAATNIAGLATRLFHAGQPQTPNLNKVADNQSSSGAIWSFMQWLKDTRGLTICQRCSDEERCGEYVPYDLGDPEQLLAAFFGIDLTKAAQERQAMVAYLQQAEQKVAG